MRKMLNAGLAAAWSPREYSTQLSAPAPLPVLDLVHLSRQTCGDSALELELLTTFEQQAGLILARLNEGKSAALDFKADLAHTLKGSARAIGALAVAQTAEDYEIALRKTAPNAVIERLQSALFDEVATVCSVIAGLISDH